MNEIIQQPKICPSCRSLTPINQMKKIVSRSSGKTTNSWRCFACIKRKEVAIQAVRGRVQ